MPVYEYLCHECNIVFNFLVKNQGEKREPKCPKCDSENMKKLISRSYAIRSSTKEIRGEEQMPEMPDLNDPGTLRKMERLMNEMDSLDENDPGQIGKFMHKLCDISGQDPGAGMMEAIKRLEAGEDPEKIEEEMGDILEEEGSQGLQRPISGLTYDDNLYEL